ncbi:MAG: hypothetical protein ACRC1K_16885 [Planctomycetia bacterium]
MKIVLIGSSLSALLAFGSLKAEFSSTRDPLLGRSSFGDSRTVTQNIQDCDFVNYNVPCNQLGQTCTACTIEAQANYIYNAWFGDRFAPAPDRPCGDLMAGTCLPTGPANALLCTIISDPENPSPPIRPCIGVPDVQNQ